MNIFTKTCAHILNVSHVFIQSSKYFITNVKKLWLISDGAFQSGEPQNCAWKPCSSTSNSA